MSPGTPRWIVVLGQWLLCGLAGALLCFVAALVFVGTGFPPALWALPSWGLEWGLIGGAALGVVLWLFGRASRGVRPSELLLIAIVMCGLCAVVFVGYRLLWFSWHILPRLPVPPQPPGPYRWGLVLGALMPALGAFGGMVAGALLWGWPAERRPVAARKAGLAALISISVVYLLGPQWSPLFAKTREFARQASCQSNLKQLGLALSMYAEAWDGRLPPCRTANDLPGIDSVRLANMLAREGRLGESKAVLGGGALWPYVKNAGLFLCPSDPANLNWRGRPILDRFPEPGIGYDWNAKWAGKKITSVPEDEWLLRDREPWHNGGWNVAFRDGHVKWQHP